LEGSHGRFASYGSLEAGSFALAGAPNSPSVGWDSVACLAASFHHLQRRLCRLSSRRHRRLCRIPLDIDDGRNIHARRWLRRRAEISCLEWDYRKGQYLDNYARVLTASATATGERDVQSDETRALIRKVRRQFEILRPRQEILKAQLDGADLDLDALVSVFAVTVDRDAQHLSADAVRSQRLCDGRRDIEIACCLADHLSRSNSVEGNCVRREARHRRIPGLFACRNGLRRPY